MLLTTGLPLYWQVAFESFSCYKFEVGEKETSIDCEDESVTPCYTVEDGHILALVADVGIDCNDWSQHGPIVAVAMVAIILLPFGLLVVNAVLLVCSRHAILSGKVTPLSKSIDFVHREYKPKAHLYWWEVW